MNHSTRPQNKNLRPHPEKLGVTPLENHEVTEVVRVRGETESVEWFRGLSADQRGILVSQLHEIVGSLNQDLGLPEPEQGMPIQGGARGGKSADARFDKTTLYLAKDVKLAVQRRLIGTRSDLSMLVNTLLGEWLKK